MNWRQIGAKSRGKTLCLISRAIQCDQMAGYFFSIFCHWKQWKFAQQPIFFLTIDKSITVYVERFYDKIGFGWISLKVLLFHFSGVLSGSVEGTGTSLVHLHFRFQTTSARSNIQQRSPNICFPNGKFLG